MQIRTIFAVDNSEILNSIAFGNEQNEFQRLLNLWLHDVEFLTQFFEDNEADLQSGYFGEITIDTAIRMTRRNAEKLKEAFYNILNNSNPDQINLQHIFKSLNDNHYTLKPLAKEKSKAGWLRIYAIRISENVYVVSGGAIKLTATMNTRPHLELELQKLEMTKRFLIENDLTDESNFDFVELKL